MLTACGILAACVALVSVFGRAGRPDAEFEAFQELWRRYEQGDLTRWEFERLTSGAASHGGDDRHFRPLGKAGAEPVQEPDILLIHKDVDELQHLAPVVQDL